VFGKDLNASIRNKLLHSLFPARARKNLAQITRVILHSKYRRTGLGTHLVREMLPLVGRLYVETVAVMARYNPFFEKAGMTRVAESRPD